LRLTSLHPNGLAGVRIRVRGAGAQGAAPDILSACGTGRACPLWPSDAHRGWAWSLCSPPAPTGLPVSTRGFDLNGAVRAHFVQLLGANLSFVSHTRSCVFNNILASVVLKYIYFAAPLHLLTCRGYRRPYARRRATDSLSAAEFDNAYRLSRPERLVKRKMLPAVSQFEVEAALRRHLAR